MSDEVLILGAGMTGLGAGDARGAPRVEARERPGGICSSYYLRPGSRERLPSPPEDGEAYRFEIGGGHWIFGGDPLVHRLIRSLVPVKTYVRSSAVYLPDEDRLAPYPIQNHLRALGPERAARCLEEIAGLAARKPPVSTLADWLQASFGPSLCELFFEPFHELYTAGLYREIAPQDAYKSPIDLQHVVRGSFAAAPGDVGYNATFVYPEPGLDALAARLAERCQVHYGHRVERIDTEQRVVHFAGGASRGYQALLSTLPLNRTLAMAGLEVEERACPSPQVLVINIGAERGPRCPEHQWLYVPRSKAGFHRVGFYDQVDVSFLPASRRADHDRVSIYVEKAYPEGERPTDAELEGLCQAVVAELREWGWIGEAEAVDPTWIEVAYTWAWPGSRWVKESLAALERRGVYQVGRYARWVFQGIADSLRDGLVAGSAFRREG